LTLERALVLGTEGLPVAFMHVRQGRTEAPPGRARVGRPAQGRGLTTSGAV
jgi:hypothetical protein